ncbi:hypothetical protein J416_00494 [Gracilibacillus halophilus YIM-C55.5]|uniref:NERD domain-containing protein n=1 Tax=Gracilibacillus halophilus YIM-C55.5 TaxID=1308866 RepID=N4WVJ4_9BACI|nr:nuclease-related domain-containing protein [Gracilibacillus halophilus]ENH98420.1 hypothetical protein J416_00494 [Gracilibacillus halophilus YIM-C55.5]
MNLQSPHKPLYLLQLEALLNRLPDHNRSEKLESTYRRQLAGFIGESSLPFHFENLNTNASHLELYGLRLPYKHHFFQIDCLSLWQHILFHFEVKHLKGKLDFNQSGQLIQINENGQEEVYDDPILQAQYQKQKLQQFLQQHGFPHIPIKTLILFTHPKANLQFDHPMALPIQQFSHSIQQVLETSSSPHIKRPQLFEIGYFLKNQHTERFVDVIEQSGISKRKIKRGVYCQHCRHVKMVRIYGTWQCPACKRKDKYAHIPALRECVLLFGPYLTNRQVRYFLEIESIHLATRLLKQFNTPAFGWKKDRVYDFRHLLES